MLAFLLFGVLGEPVVRHNDGKTKEAVAREHTVINNPLFRPIYSGARPSIFNSDKTLLSGIDLPKQLSMLFQQAGRSREDAAKYLRAGGEAIGSVVEGQQLPRLRGGILCNPQLMDCASLGDFGAAVGEPILQRLHNSNLFGLGDEVLNQVQQLYEHATMGITDPLIDTLEMEPLVQTLEHVYKQASDSVGFLKPKGQNPYVDTYRNVVDQVVFNSADRLGYDNQKGKKLMDVLEDYITCGAWRNCDQATAASRKARLRNFNVDPQVLQGQLAPTARVLSRTRELPIKDYLQLFKGEPQALAASTATAVTIDDSHPLKKLYETVYINGFVDSCAKQGNCMASHKSMVPELFDGLYVLDLVEGESDGSFSVTYKRARVDKADYDAEQRWSRLYTDTLPELYLWMQYDATAAPNQTRITEGLMGRWSSDAALRMHGLRVAITAENPLTVARHHAVRSHPPYAVLVQPKETSCATDMFECSASPESYWLFQTVAGYGCSGIKQNATCHYPVSASILPAKVDVEVVESR